MMRLGARAGHEKAEFKGGEAPFGIPGGVGQDRPAGLRSEEREASESFRVGGMTCGGCAERVRTALAAVPGVRSARVDLAGALASVDYDPAVLAPGALAEAAVEAGYTLEWPRLAAPPAPPSALRPVAVALLGTLGMLGFYLAVVTLSQGWDHALELLAEDRWFVGPIAVGFGTQMGLWAYARMLHAQAAIGGVAVSGGASTAGMLACCAHHAADLLPVLGLSGAAIFLESYKTPLLWLAMAMNLVGIAYLVRHIRRQRRLACHVGGAQRDRRDE